MEGPVVGVTDGVTDGMGVGEIVGAYVGQLLHDTGHSSITLDPLYATLQNFATRNAASSAFFVSHAHVLVLSIPKFTPTHLNVEESSQGENVGKQVGGDESAFDGSKDFVGSVVGITVGTIVGGSEGQLSQDALH